MQNHWGDFLGECICIDISLYQTGFSCRLITENENHASFPFVSNSTRKLYDDKFVIICHISHCMSCDVSIVHAHIAMSMLKRYIVQPSFLEFTTYEHDLSKQFYQLCLTSLMVSDERSVEELWPLTGREKVKTCIHPW